MLSVDYFPKSPVEQYLKVMSYKCVSASSLEEAKTTHDLRIESHLLRFNLLFPVGQSRSFGVLVSLCILLSSAHSKSQYL